MKAPVRPFHPMEDLFPKLSKRASDLCQISPWLNRHLVPLWSPCRDTPGPISDFLRLKILTVFPGAFPTSRWPRKLLINLEFWAWKFRHQIRWPRSFGISLVGGKTWRLLIDTEKKGVVSSEFPRKICFAFKGSQHLFLQVLEQTAWLEKPPKELCKYLEQGFPWGSLPLLPGEGKKENLRNLQCCSVLRRC